ncbi:hypothetical protein TL16_g13411 [Triparma laevis f. inornata]|uniref:Uncharacterized protein n=1 Tax=Triparma laevis f. inornata TaxID=1714386 RepID=A0A9W7C5N9_9STRA|nr:hypothetical protein TL16_g13411 [Triparma laevis f. inornata]
MRWGPLPGQLFVRVTTPIPFAPLPPGKAGSMMGIIFLQDYNQANFDINYEKIFIMDKDDKTKAVKQLRARLMVQVKKLKGLKDRRQAQLDENRELTIAIAKKRGATL